MEMKPIDKAAYLIVVLGGLNSGIVAVFEYDVIGQLSATLARVVYGIIGLAALYMFYTMLVMMKDMKSDKK